ncbi:glycosyltransferase [Roseococcus sp. YIM B11640]|uniref:glycosyltransferase n=1 Tax=Roseococcus sp. YIM B11640 TaxID=3133973 RepID=UPI003C7AB58D
MSDIAVPRRVCVVSHAHPDFSRGGGEIAAYRQHQMQRAAGWRSIFVAASVLNTEQAARQSLPTVMPYEKDEYVFAFSGMTEDRLSWNDSLQRQALVRFLAGLDVDVYHFHHYWRIGFDLVAELKEARPDATFVITLHEMLAICLHHGQMIKTRGRELCRSEAPLRCLSCFPQETLDSLALRKAYMISGLRRFDHIIYCSEFLRSRYRAWGLDGPGSVLENYLGDAMWRVRRLEPSGENSMRFAFFGQPTEFKGLDILIRAMALLPKPGVGEPFPTLTIFGADLADVTRMFPDLETIIEDAGPSIVMAGRYDPADVLDLMQSVGWVLVPSIWWENSPVVIQEARRAGTPLIVSDIGGMAEKVHHEVDGLHFRRASPSDLARVIMRASDPALHERIARSQRDVITRDEFLAGLSEAFGARTADPNPVIAAARRSGARARQG